MPLRLAKGWTARHFLLKNDPRRLKRMNDGERASFRHDAAVRVAAAVAEHHHVAREWIGDFLRAVKNEPKIAFLAPVEIPIVGVRARVKRRAKRSEERRVGKECRL